MYNKIILVGNLTRDIELKYSASGSAIASTAIATSRKFTQNGERKEEVCFVYLTFFGKSGEVANQYLRKGSKLLVEGRLKFDQWVSQDGTKQSKHSVLVDTMQMMDSKPDAGVQNQAPQQNEPQQRQEGQTNSQGYKSDGSSYGNQQQAQQHTAYQPHAQQQKQSMPDQLPQIDIDEDEIPFSRG